MNNNNQQRSSEHAKFHNHYESPLQTGKNHKHTLQSLYSRKHHRPISNEDLWAAWVSQIPSSPTYCQHSQPTWSIAQVKLQATRERTSRGHPQIPPLSSMHLPSNEHCMILQVYLLSSCSIYLNLFSCTRLILAGILTYTLDDSSCARKQS